MCKIWAAGVPIWQNRKCLRVVLARQYCEIKYSMLKYRYATIKTRKEKITTGQEKNSEK